MAPAHSDLSELLAFASKEALKSRWESTREEGIEGLMLKRRDSPYLSGRPKGHWYKWKRAALTADCVLLYAQKGSGKRSSFYSDYTFGAWAVKDGEAMLVPVGKAYSGFTDEELCPARPLRPPEHGGTLRPGPLRGAEASCSKSPSTPSSPPPATSPASPCASPASPASAGTSRHVKPTRWRA
jgi:ATP-dependent DNA ligase